MSIKPSLPSGTRDFSPVEMQRRNYIFNTLKDVFVKFGYKQIETPSMEKLETLTGKYGEEGDRLIFKILNSGDFLSKVDAKELSDISSAEMVPRISERALRYDLTVPFARYVVQHRNDISFPFKRFQIQPVWRADRPQKGRYREFYQCDCDAIGTTSLLNEVELVQIYDECLSRLALPNFDIRINSRKILAGIAELVGMSDQMGKLTVIIDKLDKIGTDKVLSELVGAGLSDTGVSSVRAILEMKGTNSEVHAQLTELLGDIEIASEGLSEIKYVVDSVEKSGMQNGRLVFDPTLARGLDYYTGVIFEVVETSVNIGSIGGGGRYDELTAIFGWDGMSGVGISFGAERIYDVMVALDLFPKSVTNGTQVLFLNYGGASVDSCFSLVGQLRDLGVATELFPDEVKISKQMKYADRNAIPMVVFRGEEEESKDRYKLKNMNTGEEEILTAEAMLNKIRNDTH